MTKFPILAISDLTKDANALNDLLARFNEYGKSFSEEVGDASIRLHMVTKKSPPQNGLIPSDFPFLRIVQGGNSFITYQFFLVRYLLTHRKNFSIIIAGNPWQDYLHVLLIKPFLKNRLQVSIHGEPYVTSQRAVFSKDSLKDLWMRFSLRFADSVRVVSAHQVEPVTLRYSVKRSKLFISPIPVVIPTTLSNGDKEPLIAFVGRLHSERNLNSWLEIIAGLYAKRQDFAIVIAGDGPEKEQLLRFLDNKIPNLKVNFLGRIPHQEVQALWSNVSVLLSTAENESFGLTLREAQLAGVQVVARRNAGTLANSYELGGEIALFDTTEEAIDGLSHALVSPISPQKIVEIRALQEVINSNSLTALTKSWRA